MKCPICGGLHPAGHRDRELEEKLEAVENWHSAQLGRQVDPTDIRELGKILGAEG